MGQLIGSSNRVWHSSISFVVLGNLCIKGWTDVSSADWHLDSEPPLLGGLALVGDGILGCSLLVATPFVPSSFLFLVVRPGATSSFLLLVAMHLATSSFLLLYSYNFCVMEKSLGDNIAFQRRFGTKPWKPRSLSRSRWSLSIWMHLCWPSLHQSWPSIIHMIIVNDS